MNVTLLRHGATARPGIYAGRLDVPLAAAGRAAMWQATRGLQVQRVVSSPLSRCRLFAEALAERHGLALTVEPAWQEMDFGDWEGRTAAEILAQAPETLEAFWRDPETHAPPGGEGLADLRRRVLSAWERRPRDADLLIITHGGPMRLLFQHLLGLPGESLWRLELHPAARIDFVLDEGGPRLTQFHFGKGH
ncbi:Phosphoglycerate mutase [Thioalkalivibrio nitratireducens DSM 14787]|uniref:Phosphoglycerate mutase n=1 Tax=Thioalkalivibrio nitratireducens (strain DSM 14787 / UNIQEM 213 / ALEN2) TaxID=1255043 RepID=L0E3A5_THIND|nr:alpha-ribazole phosphatase family protein [Thioalkalivibrio nitratireducens]AGA35121.1 Phosphoglycerate mutase [Thioalkalivibrio nitratireducens DSM 14787]